ncbi:AAA family ATPase [Hoeflea alexandrii]|uniref:AAA family ATPase n=1 Tax=Hoeflea alexandrii TaxID=288436 RepID=UPI0022AF4BB4|nr:AAA family ATPase [Hoeflea alexandrii]MCZ4287267.1 AAA family ATPase [Hoeflea alexandrii]
MSTRPTLERALADLHLNRALKPFLRSRKFIVVIVLPPNADLGEWKHEVDEILSHSDVVTDDWQNEMRRSDNRADFVMTPTGADQGLEGCSLGRLKTVLLVTAELADTFVAHPSVSAADAVVRIDTLSVSYMQRAFHIAVGRKLSIEEATDLVSMPARWRRIVVRAGRNPRAIFKSFKRSQERSQAIIDAIEKPKVSDGPRLEDMHGYGEAQTWGLELAQDIADYKNGIISWADVDNGLLLSGPPGCGKTTFASALARTCGMAFIVGSYASWQAHGHQGDCLKAMRLAFSKAREQAPCVLLIDEIDNFMDRDGEGDKDNLAYNRGIVNGLLEELDGSIGRDGVVVIGACNNPQIVDPAACRPGRLDRHIEIQLPDDEARMAILKGYLQSEYDLDMRPFRTKTKGMSGADLSRLARDARRLARRERITVEYRHVNACLPKRIRRDDDQMNRIGVHEIGHAVVGVALDYAPLVEVFIEDQYVPNSGDQIAGSCVFQIDPGQRQDQQKIADRICAGLGAMACEQMIFGSHGDGVIADLVEVTTTATFALSAVGMGDTLSSAGLRDPESLSRLRMYDPRLSGRVEDLLQEQLVRAREILEERRDVVELLISELVQRTRLPGSFVYSRLEVPQPAMNFG